MLKEYAEKCDKEEAVGTLENDKTVTYVNYSGGKFLKKTLNILEKIVADAKVHP